MGAVEGDLRLRINESRLEGARENDNTSAWVTLGGGTALSRAQTVVPNGNLTKLLGSDLDNDQWYRNGGASGTITPSTTKKGGVVTLSTTATNNRTAILLPAGVIVLIDNPRTSTWYMVARFSITSAVDAQAVCALDLIGQITGTPGAPQIIFGVIGSLSTAFFSFLVQDNGGAVNASGVTTVPVDTAMHVWEVWNDGTTITFMIDGVQVATAAASGAGTNPCAPSIFAGNGTTAAARTIDADYLYFCTGDPA